MCSTSFLLGLHHDLPSQQLVLYSWQWLRQDICQLFGRWDPLELHSLRRYFVVDESILVEICFVRSLLIPFLPMLELIDYHRRLLVRLMIVT